MFNKIFSKRRSKLKTVESKLTHERIHASWNNEVETGKAALFTIRRTGGDMTLTEFRCYGTFWQATMPSHIAFASEYIVPNVHTLTYAT
ncbi:hypothetical protein CEXT_615751 [Caerostris extrusa]|uniref:Uncharacterized protein n=1 Tax=Caerostris extrusa TaxID=172846 RepID=A0AAV4SL75_CAEEX|nr:hypothetical protein CEXT_615751 [Caerostris extrusa]